MANVPIQINSIVSVLVPLDILHILMNCAKDVVGRKSDNSVKYTINTNNIILILDIKKFIEKFHH